jgi:hypothetical protein
MLIFRDIQRAVRDLNVCVCRTNKLDRSESCSPYFEGQQNFFFQKGGKENREKICTKT